MRVGIPHGIEFDALQLARDAQTGDIHLDMDVLRAVADANPGVRIETEDDICGVLVAWYRAHRAAGGDADQTMEQIAAEVEAEDRIGAWRVQIATGRPQ